jgi:sulfate/thiosulfate transport system substrate-binding protein
MQSVNKFTISLFLLVLMAVLVVGCAPAATPAPTEEPATSEPEVEATEAPEETEATEAVATEEATELPELEPVTLTLAAYTTPREAYARIIPLFQAYWKETHNQEVNFEESYEGSGAQSRAVEGGFEADIVALSLENDVLRLVNAGLIEEDWKDNEFGGMIHTSYAVLLVRPGNPLGIEDWTDLTTEGIEVLTPDPSTSGGAQWNIMAAYGAADRGHVEGFTDGEEFLRALFTNVSVMDKGARESLVNYESGVGDVIITYENEYYAGIAAGGQYEIIYPTSTILIENPAAVVNAYAEKHGTAEVAQAFVDFLYTPEAQAIFAEIGFRPPVNVETGEMAAVDESKYPTVEDVFTIADYGGWAEVGPAFFGEEGIFTLLIADIKG